MEVQSIIEYFEGQIEQALEAIVRENTERERQLEQIYNTAEQQTFYNERGLRKLTHRNKVKIRNLAKKYNLDTNLANQWIEHLIFIDQHKTTICNYLNRFSIVKRISTIELADGDQYPLHFTTNISRRNIQIGDQQYDLFSLLNLDVDQLDIKLEQGIDINCYSEYSYGKCEGEAYVNLVIKYKR